MTTPTDPWRAPSSSDGGASPRSAPVPPVPPVPPAAAQPAIDAGATSLPAPASAVAAARPSPWPGAAEPAVSAWLAGVPLRLPRWGFADAWIALLGSILLSTVVGVLLLFVPDVPAWANGVLLLSLVAQWLPMLGWPIVATRWRGNGPVLDLGLTVTRSDVGWGVVGGVGSLIAASLVAAATQALAGEFDSAAGELVDEFRPTPVLLVVLALAIGVGAPIVEEVCFRGMFWSGLAKRGVRPWWVTFWSALAFGCFHLEPVRIPLLFTIGLILGYLRQRTGRVGASIVAHVINNAPGAIAIFLF